jgi:hypothetical protein
MSSASVAMLPAGVWLIAWALRPQLATILRVGWETLRNPRGEPLI